MSFANHYAVLVRGGMRPSAEQIRRAFRAFNHLTDADAIRLAANAEGILMRHLSSDEARAFHRALEAEGVVAAFVSESALVQLSQPTRLHRIELSPEELVVFDQIGRPQRYPWEEIALLALGSLLHVGLAKAAFTSVGAGHDALTNAWSKSASSVSHRLERDFQMLLEIVTKRDRQRFQIDAASFPFGHLTEHRGISPGEKIVWLTGEFILRAPGAMLNRGAQDIRDGGQMVRGYATMQAFNDEMVWLLWNQAEKTGK